MASLGLDLITELELPELISTLLTALNWYLKEKLSNILVVFVRVVPRLQLFASYGNAMGPP